jgi:hypothetical protein
MNRWALFAVVFVLVLATAASAAWVGRRFDAVSLGTSSATCRLNFAPATDYTGGIDFGSDVNLFRSAANKLQLSDSFDINMDASSATALTYPMILTNTKNASSMTGTGFGLLFNQYYYDGTTPALVDAGYISFATGGNWTSTASTQDAIFSLKPVINGSALEVLTNDTSGNMSSAVNWTFGDAATDTVTVTGDLTVTDDVVFNDAVTLGNASTDAITCTGGFFPRQVNDAGPMTATTGVEGEIVYNLANDKFYGCTSTGAPATWAAFH